MNIVPLLTPPLGTATATVSHWYVEVGEAVQEGERIVELLIPAMAIDLHSPTSGTLRERLRVVGESVRESEPLGTIQPHGNLG